MDATLHGTLATAAPVAAAAVAALFAAAVVAVSAAGLPRADGPARPPRAPRWRREGAAGSLAGDGRAGGVGVDRWRRAERLALLAALADAAAAPAGAGGAARRGAGGHGRCAICLERVDGAAGGRQGVCLLRCLHAFHRGCVLRFLVKCSNRCPTCNGEVRSADVRPRGLPRLALCSPRACVAHRRAPRHLSPPLARRSLYGPPTF